ncbi:MAG: DUF2007 domain-containing protein [Anaerohalosphaeraceae bacterium]
MSRERLVTVAQYAEPMEADLARIALEEAGIRCVILGEPVAGGLYPTDLFTVCVQVLESDAERAAAVLNERTPLDDGSEDGADGQDNAGDVL